MLNDLQQRKLKTSQGNRRNNQENSVLHRQHMSRFKRVQLLQSLILSKCKQIKQTAVNKTVQSRKVGGGQQKAQQRNSRPIETQLASSKSLQGLKNQSIAQEKNSYRAFSKLLIEDKSIRSSGNKAMRSQVWQEYLTRFENNLLEKSETVDINYVQTKPIVKQFAISKQLSILDTRLKMDSLKLKRLKTGTLLKNQNQAFEKQKKDLKLQKLKQHLKVLLKQRQVHQDCLIDIQSMNMIKKNIRQQRYQDLRFIKDKSTHAKYYHNSLETCIQRLRQDIRLLDKNLKIQISLKQTLDLPWKIPDCHRFEFQGELQDIQNVQIAQAFNQSQKVRISLQLGNKQKDKLKSHEEMVERVMREREATQGREKQQIERIKSHLQKLDQLKRQIKISDTDSIFKFRKNLKESYKFSSDLLNEVTREVQLANQRIRTLRSTIQTLLIHQQQTLDSPSEFLIEKKIIELNQQIYQLHDLKSRRNSSISLIINSLQRISYLATGSKHVQRQSIKQTSQSCIQTLTQMRQFLLRQLKTDSVPSTSKEFDLFRKHLGRGAQVTQ